MPTQQARPAGMRSLDRNASATPPDPSSACDQRFARLRVHSGRSRHHAARPSASSAPLPSTATTSFVKRARAAEALEQLDRFRTRMEKAFQDNGNYGVGTCAVPLPTGVEQFGLLLRAVMRLTRRSPPAAIGVGHRCRVTNSASTIKASGAPTQFPGATVPADCWMVEKNRCQ